MGCQHAPKDYSAQLPPGQMALRKLALNEYPDFSVNQTDIGALQKAINNSLAYMKAPSSHQYFPYLDISHERAVATLLAMREDLMQAQAGPRLNQIIASRYDVYKSIGAPNVDSAGYSEKVLFTGYYTPILQASTVRTGAFQYPIYKRPGDLLTDPEGITASRQTPDGRYVLYYTRADIEKNNLLNGQELLWLKSKWEAYVVSVQGSGIFQTTDGRRLEVGYAGNNGYPYYSPGKKMLADGIIMKDQLSFKGLSAFFAAHPEEMDRYLQMNPRYVFFTERPGGPFGSLNVPVTPRATIATDHQVYPRALPSYLTTAVPVDESGTTKDYRGFMMDQDTGGAIRASGRCDIYMGIGDSAGQIAGHQMQEGELYYIALKPEFMGSYRMDDNAAKRPLVAAAGGGR